MRARHAIGWSFVAAMVSAAPWVGCSSNSNNNASDAGTDAAPLTFSQVYKDVIGPYCSGCHGGSPAPDGGVRGGLRVGMLSLATVDAGYMNLVNVRAQGTSVPAVDWTDAAVCNTLAAGAPGSMRVVPGNAAESLLCLKVNGFNARPPCGAPMPEPTPGPGEIDGGIGQQAAFAEIQQWINEGANP